MPPSAAAVLDFMLLLRPSLARGSRFSLSPELRRCNTAGCILQVLVVVTEPLCPLFSTV
jgi:hypothetical protein